MSSTLATPRGCVAAACHTRRGRRNLAVWDASQRVDRWGMKIEYHCPTHGRVEPDDEGAPVPSCPMMIRQEVDGKVVPETCGQPLTAYMG